MVNENTTLHIPDFTDKEIIHELSQCSDFISGVALAATFSMSRVALWKRIEALKSLGFCIETSRKGYALRSEDTLLNDNLLFFTQGEYKYTTNSTMDDALILAKNKGAHGSIVVAESQTNGRGRNDKSWISPHGGIYMTMILRSHIPITYAPSIIIETACTIVDFLQKEKIQSSSFKWPNDIYIQDAKVGGILLELYGPIEKPNFYLLGIGINTFHVEINDRKTTSLDAKSLSKIKRRDLIAHIQKNISSWTKDPKFSTKKWDDYSFLKKGREFFSTNWQGQISTHIFNGFAPNGALKTRSNKELSFSEIVNITYQE